MQKASCISVTGTKGKTTVVNILSDVLRRSGNFDNVLHVDTTGHYLNGKRKSTLQDSLALWGLVPTVSPGRYLYEFLPPKFTETKNVAVLESALGSSTLAGLGYKYHQVGIFLNVLEDHLGSSSRLQTRDDILKAKSFILDKVSKTDGWLVLNADDEYVMKLYKETKTTKYKQVKVLLIGLGLTEDILQKYEAEGFVTIDKNDYVVYQQVKKKKSIRIVSTKQVSWTFAGNFTPSLYNLMAVAAGLIGLSKGKNFKNIKELLSTSKLPNDGGRLTLFENRNGVKILADYAHEKYSLAEVAKLARSLTTSRGRVLGVVRLAYDRTDELIEDVATYIAPYYDEFIVYDKIDGYFRKPKKDLQSKKFVQEVGKISQTFTDALVKNKDTDSVTRVLREDFAIAEAAKKAQVGDVVVVIVNDNIKQSLQFIKENFVAKLV